MLFKIGTEMQCNTQLKLQVPAFISLALKGLKAFLHCEVVSEKNCKYLLINIQM